MPIVAPSLRSLSQVVVTYETTALTMPRPPNTAARDTLLWMSITKDGAGALTYPQGFTPLLEDGLPGGRLPGSANALNTTFSTPVRVNVAWKEAGANDPSSYVVRAGAATRWLALLASYKDVGSVQAGTRCYNWFPYWNGDPTYGYITPQAVGGHYFPDVETFWDNCLVVGVMATDAGDPPFPGPVSLMDWMTQGLAAQASRMLWPGVNPMLALFDGLQEAPGVRAGMSALMEGGGVSTCYSFALIPRIPTDVTAEPLVAQQGLYTAAGALFSDPAEPVFVDGQGDFRDSLTTANVTDLGVEGEPGAARVRMSWKRRGVLA